MPQRDARGLLAQNKDKEGEMTIDIDSLSGAVLAAGGLGTAAFGIVEALKWTWLGYAGFGSIKSMLGPLLQTYQVAYGPAWERLLSAQYRGDRAELTRVLRQGVRIGLTAQNAGAIATFIGTVSPADLESAARHTTAGTELPAELRNVLGRFELADDSRIDAAQALAQERYSGATRVSASVISLAVAIIVGMIYDSLGLAVMIGIAAVPLAPIAKDLVTAIQSASTALRGR